MNKLTHIAGKTYKIRQVFGLNLMQLTQILGLGNVAVLHRNIMSEEQYSKLNKMYRNALLVEKVVNADISPFLKSKFVNGKTLLTHLRDVNIDIYFLVWICKQLEQQCMPTPVISKSQQHQTVRLHSTQS